MEQMEGILKILEENARIPLEDLAAMVCATPQQVAAAMDAYREKHVLNGYRALVDWEKLGDNHVQALIELKVSPKRDRGFEDVANAVAHFKEVDSVYLMSGGYDIAVFIRGKSLQDIALFVAKRLSPMDDVLGTATHFMLRTYKKDGAMYNADPADERENLN